jgi:hypothetical protein
MCLYLLFGAGEDFAVLVVTGEAQAVCRECAQGTERGGTEKHNTGQGARCC